MERISSSIEITVGSWCRECADAVRNQYRTGAFRIFEVLELSRYRGNSCVENIPGHCPGLAEHFRGLFGISARFVTEPAAPRIDLKAALHDHGPGDQDIVRGRNRTVALIGAKT